MTNNGVTLADAQYWQGRGVDAFDAVTKAANGWTADVDKAHDEYMYGKD